MPGSADIARGNLQGTFLLQIVNSFVSVAANTTAQQTVTVNGLQLGDQISAVSKSTFQAGLIVVGADVSAANTLRVTFGNFTGGGIVPTAGDTYTVEINRPSNQGTQPSSIV